MWFNGVVRNNLVVYWLLANSCSNIGPVAHVKEKLDSKHVMAEVIGKLCKSDFCMVEQIAHLLHLSGCCTGKHILELATKQYSFKKSVCRLLPLCTLVTIAYCCM